MAAVAHSPAFAQKVGIQPSVGRDFMAADKRAGKYAEGGEVKTPMLFAVPDYSRSVAYEMYPGQLGQDDQQDAARHMLAAGTLARKYGPGVAMFLGKAHEASTSPLAAIKKLLGLGEMPPDYRLDMHNNRLGVELARRAQSQADLERLVQEAAERAGRGIQPGRAVTGYQAGGAVKQAFQAGGLAKALARLRGAAAAGEEVARAPAQNVGGAGKAGDDALARYLNDTLTLKEQGGALVQQRGRGALLADMIGQGDSQLAAALRARAKNALESKAYAPESEIISANRARSGFVIASDPAQPMRDLPAAWRWESRGRKLYDPGVVHYDVSGGRAVPDIVQGQPIYVEHDNPDLFSSPSLLDDILRKTLLNGRVRVGALSDVSPDKAVYIPDDPWAYPGAPRLQGRVHFYPNMHEGAVINRQVPNSVSVRDILNDPALRRELNLSVAVPAQSELHKRSMVFKAKGGLAQLKECTCG